MVSCLGGGEACISQGNPGFKTQNAGATELSGGLILCAVANYRDGVHVAGVINWITCTIIGTSTIRVPEELARKLETAAAACGTTPDALATELLEGHVLDEGNSPRRVPRLVGIGASDEGTSHLIDELLAEGFGSA